MQNHLPKVAILKTVLKSFTNFTGKNLWWSPFLVKLYAATLLKKNWMTLLQLLNLFRMGLFGAAQGWGGGSLKRPRPKIYHTYPTMMKLGSYTFAKEDPKNMWITWHTSWVMLTSAISMFSLEFKEYKYRFHFGTYFLILLKFFGFLKIVLINMVCNLDDVTKNGNPRSS